MKLNISPSPNEHDDYFEVNAHQHVAKVLSRSKRGGVASFCIKGVASIFSSISACNARQCKTQRLEEKDIEEQEYGKVGLP